jgi:Bacterial protein of unknown function (DUF948)
MQPIAQDDRAVQRADEAAGASAVQGGFVTAGQIAALIAAGAFALLVLLMIVPLVKLCRTLDEATLAIRQARERSDPLLTNANTAIVHVNSQLRRVDVITAEARAVAGSVSALTSLFAATLGGPLVKMAAFGYGIRRALHRRRRPKALDEAEHGGQGRNRTRGLR